MADAQTRIGPEPIACALLLKLNSPMTGTHSSPVTDALTTLPSGTKDRLIFTIATNSAYCRQGARRPVHLTGPVQETNERRTRTSNG